MSRILPRTAMRHGGSGAQRGRSAACRAGDGNSAEIGPRAAQPAVPPPFTAARRRRRTSEQNRQVSRQLRPPRRNRGEPAMQRIPRSERCLSIPPAVYASRAAMLSSMSLLSPPTAARWSSCRCSAVCRRRAGIRAGVMNGRGLPPVCRQAGFHPSTSPRIVQVARGSICVLARGMRGAGLFQRGMV